MLSCNMWTPNKNTIALGRFRRNIANCCAGTALALTSGMFGIENHVLN